MRNTLLKCTIFVLVLLESTCGRTPDQNPRLLIATAANMQFAMAEIADLFSDKTGIPCELVISSSGKLTAQIKEGAPYNVLVAANRKYPEEIYQSGLAEAPPKVYAYGKLVLWTMYENIVPSLDILTSDVVEHIALANPKTAPYGAAALEVLNNYDLYEEVKDKLVFGESVAQANQFIVSQAAEIGFTAMSAILSSEMKGKGEWFLIEDSTHAPIEQTVVVIKGSAAENQAAKAFYEFLFSAEVKEVLTNFGYSVTE